MTIHLEQPLSHYTVTADNRPGNSVARPPVISVVDEKEHITISLRLVLGPTDRREVMGCTKRSGLNRGRSPRYVGVQRLPGRQYLALSGDTASRCHYRSCPSPCCLCCLC